MHTRRIIGSYWLSAMLAAVAPTAKAAYAPTPDQAAIDQTPPRLSFVDGQVSFWRPGAQGLGAGPSQYAPRSGDQLSTGYPAILELQIGVRAFVRGRANTQIGLENQEPDFTQFKVTAGSAAFDLRGWSLGKCGGGHAERRLHHRASGLLSCGRCRRAHLVHHAPDRRATVIRPAGRRS